jgi:hypothetical protein
MFRNKDGMFTKVDWMFPKVEHTTPSCRLHVAYRKIYHAHTVATLGEVWVTKRMAYGPFWMFPKVD